MKIALIFPPYSPKIFSENLSTVDEEFAVAPPIILAYVAAILEKHSHEVMLLDARVLNMSKEQALARIKGFNPDMIGFRAETYHFHDSLEWVSYLKSYLNIPVVTGGVNMTLYPKETLSHDAIDYGIIGEAIESLPRLISALENNDDFSSIPGVAYKTQEGSVVINPPSNNLVDFDSYPYPARHLLQNDQYYSFISQRKNFTIMLTSTGCPFRCTFCAIPSVHRVRSPQSIIDEIDMCYKDFNIREIDFFDAVLFTPRKRILEILRLLKERKYDLEWSCRARVDIVDDEILREAAAAGCRQIYYGIESVDKKVLDAVNKRIMPEKVIRALELTRKYNISSMGFFMVGNAEDTYKTVRKTIEFSKKLNLDFIQVCRTIAKPGTDLDKQMIEFTGKDLWREHVSGKKIDKRLPSPWSNLSEWEKALLTKEFYLKFYFRPKIILRRLQMLKSFEELKRYVRVGIKMVVQRLQIPHIVTDTTEAEKILKRSRTYLDEARNLKVSVVIPTYNEKDTIVPITSKVLNVLPGANIVIVDDGSPDGTGDIAEGIAKDKTNVHVIHRMGKRGLGFAYKDGFRYILDNLDSDYVFEMDADFSHNPWYLPLFLHYAQSYDLVTGTRFFDRVSIKDRTLWRNVISKITKWFVNILTDLNLTDVTTGFKCFQRKMLEKIKLDDIKSEGYAFQIEGSYYVKRLNGRIKEIPILFIERSVGYSKMSWRIMFEGMFLIFKLTLKRFISNKIKHGI